MALLIEPKTRLPDKLPQRLEQFLQNQHKQYQSSPAPIQKLNFNINERLAHTPVNSQMPALDPKNIAESYAAITNQIQLKNLQLKVGNMKRKVVQV